MATTDTTSALLSELETIDEREDRILETLVRQGTELEEARRRSMLVTVGDLRALRDGLAGLEAAIDDVQARTARAEVAAKEPGEPATNDASDPAKAVTAPAPMPSFEELGARIRAQDAEADRMRALLRERLIELGAVTSQAASTPAPPNGGPTAPIAGPVDAQAAGTMPAADPVATQAATGATPIALAPPTPQTHVAAVPRTFRLLAKPMSGNDVKAFQHDLNRRFEAWDIDIRVREDGRYGEATRHAARQVLRGLGVDPADHEHGITPQLRTLIRRPSTRTPQQLALATVRRPWLRALRERASDATKPRTAKHRAGTKIKDASAPVSGGVAAAIRAHGGRYEDIIVHEARRHGLPVALVCAVVECESGFSNVFGHDAVRNPIKSPAGGRLAVTEQKYKEYLRHRRAGKGAQGVGPMQLTSPGLQDKADAVGGCWKPSANIRIGCEFLAGNMKRLGRRPGIRAYNGSGPAAERYATTVLAREAVWDKRLAGAAATVARPQRKPSSKKGTPRTFKLTNPPMAGSDVKLFQHDLNSRMEAWKIHSRVSEDGRYGKTTRHAAQQVLLGLGVAEDAFAHGITPQLRGLVRHPTRRTPQQLERAKARRPWLDKLRKQSASKGALRLRAYAEARRLENLNVREVGGNNRGPIVSQIIKGNSGVVGEPWCGDFMAWCYRKAGSKSVTRSWAGVKLYLGVAGLKRTSNPLKGDLVRYLDGAGHIGMFVCWCDARGHEVDKSRATHIKTIEGNTSSSGAVVSDSARGGDGVYEKVRARGFNGDYIHVSR